MKTQLFNALSALALVTTSATALEQTTTEHKASYIEMYAVDRQKEAFAQFLAGAAPLVKETEPGTELWFALQGPENKLAIFDVFVDQEARNAHFSGDVAGALNEKADTLVEGGWDDGVVANIHNSSVLSAKAPVDLYDGTTATYIKLEAATGKGEALAELLTAAGRIVAETEPETLFWVALQLDGNKFAIFDVFANEAGRTAHFGGKVAGLLKERSSVLIEGGWADGVVANISNFDILATK